MLLKVATVVMFLLLGWFLNPLTVAEMVIIVAAIDFWVTKNLAGRLLVGLRWWVDFDENGE
jgi:glucan phosphoethanolaminetransferase (alkaline phosphatase superfamily)